jgi:hypothetical protein
LIIAVKKNIQKLDTEKLCLKKFLFFWEIIAVHFKLLIFIKNFEETLAKLIYRPRKYNQKFEEIDQKKWSK